MASAIDKGVNARFLDASEEPNQALLPIRGYEKEPLLPLEEAVQPLDKLFNDLDIMVDIAKRNSKKPLDNITPNESAAIHLYTMQWEEPHTSLFTALNGTLRSERREPLKPWFRYLKLFLTALYKLPSQKSTVWRGVRGNLSDQYEDDHIWWGFSSCTESVAVMEQFVGNSGLRTLFNIECLNGKAIRAHSFYKKESEILIMPGTYFRVVGKWSPAKDLHIVHLRETPAPRPYLESPFKSSPSVASASAASPPPIEKPEIQNLKISKEKDPPYTSTASKQPKVSATVTYRHKSSTSETVHCSSTIDTVHNIEMPTAQPQYASGKSTTASASADGRLSQVRQVKTFHEIESSGIFNIILTVDPSKPESVTLKGDDSKSFDKIETSVNSGVLHIHASSNNSSSSNTHHQQITTSVHFSSTTTSSTKNNKEKTDVLINAHLLNSLQTSGMESVEIAGAGLTAERFQLTCSGFNTIRGTVQVKELNAIISGFCKVYLMGNAKSLTLDISGRSRFECFDLITRKAQVSIYGNCYAELHCDKTMTVNNEDNSTIKYKGKATIVQPSGENGGKIEKVN